MSAIDLPIGTVGILHWVPGDGVALPLMAVASDLGVDTVRVAPDEDWPVGLVAVIVHGPLGSMIPIIQRLEDIPRDRRPALVYWLTEQLTSPRWPGWLRRGASDVRSWLDRRLVVSAQSERRRPLRDRAARLRYEGNIRWMAKRGYPDLLFAASELSVRILQDHGVAAQSAHIGVASSWHSDLGLQRDIDVLWIGKLGSSRRGRLLDDVERRLMGNGLHILRIDGVHHPYVFGDDRTRLLNRSKIALNLLRRSWDDNSRRLFLASANRALVVSETMYPHTQFRPDQHYIEAPSDAASLAAVVTDVLGRWDQMTHIRDRAYRLCMEHYTMQASLARVMGELGRTLRRH